MTVSTFVATGDAELHVATRGEGPLAIVLTAIGTRPYELQMPAALDRHLRLAFVDLRGGGRSTGDPRILDFDRLACDLDAVRRSLGGGRVVILGHSGLGALAIEAARRLGDAVSLAVAVGTPPFGDLGRLAAEADRFFAEDASLERRRLLEENLAALPADAPPGLRMFAETPKRFFDPRLDARPLFAGAQLRPALLAHLFGTLLPGWSVLADPPPVPLLLLHGRFDYVVPHRLWQGIVERLPRATFRLFEKSGHQPFVDEPEAFVEALVAG